MTESHRRSDEALVVQYARFGDKSAFEELLRRHFESSYQIAYRSLKDPARADDCVQEAFVAMIRSARRFEAGRAFRPWWEGILFNMIRRERHRARRRKGHEDRYARKREARAGSAAESELLAAEIHDRVGALPAELRSAVLLRFYEGKTHKEVAAELGCPAGTASSRIRRGLEQLRGSLTQAGYGCAIGELESLLSSLPALGSRTPPIPKLAALESLARPAASTLSKVLIAAAILSLCALSIRSLDPDDAAPEAVAPSTVARRSMASPARPVSPASPVLEPQGSRPPAQSREHAPGEPGGRRAAETRAPEETIAEKSPSAAAKPRSDRVLLRVRWRGAAIAPGSLAVVVDRQEAEDLRRLYEPVVTRIGADEEDIDISALFRDESDRSGLFVRISHPLHRDRDDFLPLQAARREPGARVFVLEPELEPASALEGRVVDERGRPLTAVSLAAFALRLDGPGAEPIALAESDAEGHFRLKCAADARALVVAFQEGRSPAGLEVTAELGREKALGDWPLLRGQTIAGRVLVSGAPARGASVEARAVASAGDRRLSIGPGVLWRASGVVELASASAVTDEGGAYRIAGLARSSYEVRPRGIGAYAHSSLFEAAALDRDPITAPREGVNFEVGAVELRVAIEDMPALDLARFTAEDDHAMVAFSVRPRFSVLLEPDREYVLRVERKGFQDWRLVRRFAPSPTGYDLRVVQAPGQQPPRLLVRFETGAGPSPTSARFRFESLDEPKRQRGFLLGLGRPGLPVLITELGAGRWRMLIQPGALFQRSQYGPIEAVVDLVEGRTTERSFVLEPGGRLRITARDARGAIVPANCRLFNESGGRLPAEFKSFRRSFKAGGARDTSAELHEDRLGAGGPSELAWPLAPGSYTVELKHKTAGNQRVQFSIQTGRVSEIDVRLDPGLGLGDPQRAR